MPAGHAACMAQFCPEDVMIEDDGYGKQIDELRMVYGKLAEVLTKLNSTVKTHSHQIASFRRTEKTPKGPFDDPRTHLEALTELINWARETGELSSVQLAALVYIRETLTGLVDR
jgi:ribosome-binding protein aMBF1 (putative translation factor)